MNFIDSPSKVNSLGVCGSSPFWLVIPRRFIIITLPFIVISAEAAQMNMFCLGIIGREPAMTMAE